MFTGIVQGRAEVIEILGAGDIVTLLLRFPDGALSGITQGASVSIHGCCLSVVSFQGNTAQFEMVPETVSRSIFGALKIGDEVHYERSLRFGDEVGGHILSGHIDVTASVVDVVAMSGCKEITFRIAPCWMKYILPKGYIAVDGASLTVAAADMERATFKVSLIPETLRVTAFDRLFAGDRVNIEIDRTTQAIVDTVERVVISRGISLPE